MTSHNTDALWMQYEFFFNIQQVPISALNGPCGSDFWPLIQNLLHQFVVKPVTFHTAVVFPKLVCIYVYTEAPALAVLQHRLRASNLIS